MADIVIAGAVRTPQGSLGGALKNFTNHELGKVVLQGLFEKTSLPPHDVDEVIFGCVGQQSDAANVARVIALFAGLKPEIPAFTVNRNCAAGLQAVVSAHQMIVSHDAELVIAGGVEVMSASPYVSRDMRFGKRLRHSQMIDTLWEGLMDPVSGLLMGQTAEILVEEFKIPRRDQDEYALLSHERAFLATREGHFKDEIVKVMIAKKVMGQDMLSAPFLNDESINPDLDLKLLSQYPSAFKTDGTITSGNSCSISDGAAALIVTTREKASNLGLEILATIRGYGFAGVDPGRMGIGPVVAIPVALEKAKLKLRDIELFEINEAFAGQYLAVEKSLNLDRDKVNVNGGAIALGHPVGATGARLIVTIIHEMKRRDVSLGLASMCVGGGQGGAIILERS